MGEASTRAILNSVLTRYRIDERLGSGGMARVYKGFDTTLNRPVAIKILHDYLADDPTFMERFKREAQFVASFNHPNIVQVYDFNTIENGGETIFYMVMSYVSGGTLQDMMDKSKQDDEIIPHERSVAIVQELLSALGYAHERGMVHRDIKPANILFTEDGRAVLTDFGIARMTENSKLTQEGLTVGTPAYMSPEQATGQQVDRRSDLYAVGIILYELLTGFPPYADDGTLSVLLKHINDPIPSLSKYLHVDNALLDSVIYKSLAKLPEDRYQTAADFIADLEAAATGEMPAKANFSTRNVSTPTFVTATTETNNNLQTKRHRSQSPLGVLAVGVVIIGMLLFVGFLTQRDEGALAATPTTEEAVQDSLGVSSMVEMPVYFDGDFLPGETYNIYWPQDDVNGLTREISEDGIYRIDSERSGQAITTIFEIGTDYEDHAISMNIQLEEDSSPTSGYGIVFRYMDDDNYNVFAVDGVGRYSIWARQDGEWRELREIDENWTRNETINNLGEMNTLLVEIIDDQLIGYVNGEWITTVEDDSFETGKVGVYIASPANGNTAVAVDMFQVMETIDTFTSSMTGDEPTPAPDEQ